MRTKPTRYKARSLRIDAETAFALDDMMARIEAKSRGLLWSSEAGKRRIIQAILRSAFEAVVNFDVSEQGEVVTFTDADGHPIFAWPLVFDVRPETRDEMELRVMLQRLSEGEPVED